MSWTGLSSGESYAKDVQVHTLRFMQTAWRVLQLKSRVAIGRQLHTREFQHRSAMRSCYHQNLSSDKRRPALVFLARTDNVTSVVFSYEWSSFLSTVRATRRPQSSRMDARRAEALSSARLANAVPGSSCPCKVPRSANSCSSNWRPGPRGKVPSTDCEGEKPPLRLRLFLVLTNGLGDRVFLSSKPWTACSAPIRFSTALNNPPCRSTLPTCSGLSTPAWRIWTPCRASVRAKTPRLWTPRSQLKVYGQPAHPTHKLTKLSKHSRLDGETCPCRSSTTC